VLDSGMHSSLACEGRKVLECAGPPALFGGDARAEAIQGGRGLPHSKTLARHFQPGLPL
jgi:hypothetical protein